MNDFLLFAKVRDGDIRAFETLFKRYYEPLCLYSNKVTSNIDMAEEIVQQLFYTLWKDRADLRIVLSVKSYLYRAVRNQSLQYVRHLQVREKYHHSIEDIVSDNHLDTPQDIMEYKELEQQVETALSSLPKRSRDIFRMNRFEGKKYTQIAQELSLSVKTVEAEMSKTLKVLRKKVQK